MRILFATHHKYPPEIFGGLGVNTHRLACGLLERGHHVAVVAGLKGVGRTGLSARLRMKLLRDPSPQDRRMGYPVWRSWNPATVVEKLSAKFKPDVAVLQGGAHFAPMLQSLLCLGIPVVAYLHTSDRLPMQHDAPKPPRLSFLANSSYTASLHGDKYVSRIIPPLVHPEDYQTETDRSSAIFVNPAGYKGLDIVLALARARPDVSFLFIVNSMRKSLDISGFHNIRVIAPVEDMRKVYGRARVVLAPSKEETWGRIATEAHVNGIPLLASNAGGLPEAVGPGGICLPFKAPTAEWVRAFSRLWDDPATYAHFSRAAQRYSQRKEIQPEYLIRAFEAHLDSLVKPSDNHWQ
ncbi:glycosyltransferase [Halorhodospira sp. 9621]|uniref:glycosyltransferase n=1 Tax=Halorhodospira TaxID=85108 RepID=UPI001EE7DC09|nr:MULTISPECIES: glycosyltransferase [Halorhodospira]MCG5527922.1 glycosyltransferase [Halorhodospira halophila]MCG5533250.1 glycosyltransferase [Halorhodospira sp. 9621]MCG5542208.1 glycosyltransferase [Halorhodospira sp. 9628]